MPEPRLTDAQRAALDVGASLSVTAGAGSGKTTVLVERYLRVLDERGALPREVLAITFTQKAAAEMRARLTRRLAERPPGDPRTERLRSEITTAPISTIHAFCGDVLREFAIEAGVDPSFEVLEAIEQKTLLREEIDDLLRERASAGDPDVRLLARTISRRELAGSLEELLGKRDAIASWARSLRAEDDEALIARWGRLPGAMDPARLLSEPALRGDIEQILRASALPVALEDTCAAHARTVAALVAGRAVVDRKALHGLGLLTSSLAARSFGRAGSKKAWGKAHDADLVPTREALGRLAAQVERAMRAGAVDLDRAMLPTLRALASLSIDLLRRYRARKDGRSLLDFDDLVFRTAGLLGDRERRGPRTRLRERFQAILVDEFQDVDPMQWRIIEALATDDAGAFLPARLFAVGDEKQSIYRFRGADVSIFRGVQERLPVIALDDGFRSLPEVVRWTNEVFERIFTTHAAPWEARPGPLRARREPKPGEGPGEVAYVVLPKPTRGGRAGDAGEGGAGEAIEGVAEGIVDAATAPADVPGAPSEPEVVARLAARAIEGGRSPSDVAILLRRRTHLKAYEAALRRLRVPFAVHGGIGFYGAPEVLDAASLLAFLADPRADVALAGVLRSPFASLADGTLLLAADLRGEGAPTLFDGLLRAAAAPSALEGRIDAGELAALRRTAALLVELRAEADLRPAADLLRRALDASGARAAYGMGDRGAQALANLEKLLDAARRFEERGFRGLVRLSEMIEGLVAADESEGEAEVGALGQGVKVLTVHASKGLEFPVVILPECGARIDEDAPALSLEEIEPGRPEVAITVEDPILDWARGRSRLGTLLAERSKEKGEAEMRRLFYVACTRAMDRLVLVGKDGVEASWLGWTAAAGVEPHVRIDPATLSGDPLSTACLAAEGHVAASLASDGAILDPARSTAALEDHSAPLPAPPTRASLSPSGWKQFRSAPEVFIQGAQSRLPASLLAPEEAPWMGGRDDQSGVEAGAGVDGALADRRRVEGIAIHRLLELSRAPEDPANRAEVERVLDEEGISDVAAIDGACARGRAALEAVAASEVGCAIASAGPGERLFERSLTLALPEGLVQGRLDLLLTSGAVPRLVDWKTDEVPAAAAEAEARTRGYLLQIAVYALGVARTLGVREVQGTLFFTTPGVAVERRFDAARLAAVEAALRADLAAIGEGRPEPSAPLEDLEDAP